MLDGGRGQINPPPGPAYTPQSVVSQFPPTHPGFRAVGGRQQTGGVDTINSSFAAPCIYLPFPFSGNPVSSQYLDTLLSYWPGLSLVPLSCHIPSFMAEASSTGPLPLYGSVCVPADGSWFGRMLGWECTVHVWAIVSSVYTRVRYWVDI